MLILCDIVCCLSVEIKLTMRPVPVYAPGREATDASNSLTYQSNSHSSPSLLYSNLKVNYNRTASKFRK